MHRYTGDAAKRFCVHCRDRSCDRLQPDSSEQLKHRTRSGTRAETLRVPRRENEEKRRRRGEGERRSGADAT